MSDGAKTEADKPEAVPVIATIELTEGDVRAGLIELGGGVWRLGAVVAVVAGVFLTFAGRNGRLLSPAAIAPVAVMVVLYATFSFLIPSRNAKNQIDVLKRAGDTNVTYRFDDDGFTIRSASATASVAYRALGKTRRGKSTLLLFTTGQIAQLVPLRAFTTDESARVLAFLPPDQKAIGGTPWKRVVVLWVVLVAAFLAIWLFLNSETPNESATHPRRFHNDR